MNLSQKCTTVFCDSIFPKNINENFFPSSQPEIPKLSRLSTSFSLFSKWIIGQECTEPDDHEEHKRSFIEMLEKGETIH